jgi:beta-phosphoglucomutase-like phosphatase (HAD superfamily)
MIKLIIFDLDGVLVDMKDMHFLTLNAAISDYDSKFAISYNEHLSKYDGMKTYDKLTKLSIEKGLPQDSHKQQQYRHLLRPLLLNHSMDASFKTFSETHQCMFGLHRRYSY